MVTLPVNLESQWQRAALGQTGEEVIMQEEEETIMQAEKPHLQASGGASTRQDPSSTPGILEKLATGSSPVRLLNQLQSQRWGYKRGLDGFPQRLPSQDFHPLCPEAPPSLWWDKVKTDLLHGSQNTGASTQWEIPKLSAVVKTC